MLSIFLAAFVQECLSHLGIQLVASDLRQHPAILLHIALTAQRYWNWEMPVDSNRSPKGDLQDPLLGGQPLRHGPWTGSATPC